MTKHFFMKYWIWIIGVLLFAFSSCQTESEVDWMKIYKNVKHSNLTQKQFNDGLEMAITQQAKVYVQFKPLQTRSIKFINLTKQLKQLIGSIKTKIQRDLKLSAPLEIQDNTVLRNRKSIYKILYQQHYLDSLIQHIKFQHSTLLDLVEGYDAEPFKESIYMSYEKKDFESASIAKCLALFEQLYNDMLRLETMALNYWFGMTGTVEDSYPTYFMPLVDVPKTTVHQNEIFKATIYLGMIRHYSSVIEISVNGKRLRIKDHQSVVKMKTNTLGKHKYHVSISEKNPVTGQIYTYKRTFEYEVIE